MRKKKFNYFLKGEKYKMKKQHRIYPTLAHPLTELFH